MSIFKPAESDQFQIGARSSGRPDRRHGCEALLREAERVVAIRSKLSIASPALAKSSPPVHARGLLNGNA
jgi:hypothetical protein